MSQRETFRVGCAVCFDRGVIHFTDLAPSKRHEPAPGVRPVPLAGQVWSRQQAAVRAALPAEPTGEGT